MRRFIYFILAASLLAACKSEPHFTIKADIAGSDGEVFFLQKRTDDAIITIDSAISRKGTFKMRGSVDFPDLVQLIAVNTYDRVYFYLENSDIKITGKLDSLADARISGSVTQDEYQSLMDADKPMSERYNNLLTGYQVARQTNDTQKIASYQSEIEALEKEMITMQKDFVKNNPSSYVSPAVLRGLVYEMEGDELEAVIENFDQHVAEMPVVQELKTLATAMKAVSVGQKAPDFTMNDVNGNPVSLYSKIGSGILLIDFWAGWCAPCRQENPNLVRIYNTFNKKGFDIFGVSLDQSKDDWLKAIADDKLTWTHVSDLQYFNNSAARLYAVNAIPSNFLLDGSGTIIARNLRGNALYEKVNELLGQ
jgi:peroxiredoxin